MFFGVDSGAFTIALGGPSGAAVGATSFLGAVAAAAACAAVAAAARSARAAAGGRGSGEWKIWRLVRRGGASVAQRWGWLPPAAAAARPTRGGAGTRENETRATQCQAGRPDGMGCVPCMSEWWSVFYGAACDRLLPATTAVREFCRTVMFLYV